MCPLLACTHDAAAGLQFVSAAGAFVLAHAHVSVYVHDCDCACMRAPFGLESAQFVELSPAPACLLTPLPVSVTPAFLLLPTTSRC